MKKYSLLFLEFMFKTFHCLFDIREIYLFEVRGSDGESRLGYTSAIVARADEGKRSRGGRLLHSESTDVYIRAWVFEGILVHHDRSCIMSWHVFFPSRVSRKSEKPDTSNFPEILIDQTVQLAFQRKTYRLLPRYFLNSHYRAWTQKRKLKTATVRG